MLAFPFVIAVFLASSDAISLVDVLDESGKVALKEPFNDYVNWDNSIYYILSFNKVNDKSA
jgi:hypothetical protein